MEITDIWKDYAKGRAYLDSVNLFSKTETCHNFVNGDQWNGLKYAGERPPQLNILLPMMRSNTAVVGQHTMTIQYTSLNYGTRRSELLAVCDKLNHYARKLWEKLKMDKLMWDVLEDAYIAGDSFIYFYDDDSSPGANLLCQTIDTTNIMLADEHETDLQRQPYILIARRKDIGRVKQMARSFGAGEEEIAKILPDTDEKLQLNGKKQVDKNRKVTLVAKMWKENGNVHIMRAVRNRVIQPDTRITGMTLYPIAQYTWKQRKGLARGDGDVWDKIPNQISINKSLYRLEQAVKNAAYPIKVYRGSAVTPQQAAKLNQPGRSISLQGAADRPLANTIGFLRPGAISSYATSYWQDLITLTRSLSGGGENLENINPENTSGVAIQRAMEIKNMWINRQLSAYRQFAEDIARIWFDMAVAYNPGGLAVQTEKPDGTVETQHIPTALLKALNVDIKVEVASASETLAAMKDMQLKDFLDRGQITFAEYVSSLGADSTMPVENFKRILAQRQERQKDMPQLTVKKAGDENEMPDL